MTDLHEQLLAAFQEEQKEYVDGMRSLLARMERGDVVGPADLDEVFRQAHSLKAAARVCGFETVDKIGQHLETLFGRMRKGAIRPGKDAMEALKKVLNALEDWALALAGNRRTPEPAQALQILEQLLQTENAESKHQTPNTKHQTPAPASRPKDDLTPKLLAAFQIEHREHLEGIRSLLAEIEQGAPSAERIDEMFRRAHSLKGAARIAELHTTETLAHRLENLFARVREGALQLRPDVIRAVYVALDAIEDWAGSLEQNQAPPAGADIERVLAALEQVLKGPSAGEPPPQPARPEASRPTPARAVETVRVRADHLDRLLRSTGQLLTETLRQGLVGRELVNLARQIDALEKEWESVRTSATAELRHLAATPALARISRYLTGVERQVHALARAARAVRRLHRRSARSLQMLGGQLQQDARQVRMVSAESVFQGFRKMMRDLARDEGKEVDFRVSGLEIQADRMILQALKDPLMHMLCNAVTHGIERPQERQSQGKPPTGRVTLRLESLGNRLQVRVEDDGRGIDHRKVVETAVDRGWLSPAEAEARSPAELTRLIFRPGLSTAEAVTDLSGRGMGLSVVQETAARLQGEADVLPLDGPGTCLFLSVPLSVSTQRLLLVSCRGQTFGVPVHAIERLVRLDVQQMESVEGKQMFLLEGQPVPIADLAHLLDMSGDAPAEQNGPLALAILRSGTKRVAVAVDAFLAERDALIKPLGEPAARVSKLAGGILQEDGSVALVLNPAELLEKPAARGPVLAPRVAPAEKKTPTVLVVDDSLTTRTLEKSLLEAHGYDVRIAVDGREALNSLRAEKVDLVITDIQMPQMDGFELLAEIKKDQRLARIPVIVVTSMGRREDQERGLTLGADAYIVKRKFDHEELLNTIRQIL